MPRRNPAPVADLLGSELPEIRLLTAIPEPSRHHEHLEDPLTPMVGATEAHEPPKRRKRNVQGEEIAVTTAERKRAGERYLRYLDLVIACNGDRRAALALLYDVEIDEVLERENELHAEVMAGAGVASMGDLLKKNDVAKETRVALLKRHAFSPVPAASLKAIDMLGEMDNDKSDQAGRYESYLAAILD